VSGVRGGIRGLGAGELGVGNWRFQIQDSKRFEIQERAGEKSGIADLRFKNKPEGGKAGTRDSGGREFKISDSRFKNERGKNRELQI
jgi:hypothetical protein